MEREITVIVQVSDKDHADLIVKDLRTTVKDRTCNFHVSNYQIYESIV